jgi:predicted transcriptional regulator
MAKRDKASLTKLELKLMQVIWRQGESTVADVQAALEDEPAYTTVQTMLNILERKGKLKRTRQGRAFVYRAAVTEESASSGALRDLIERVFGGSTEDLVMSLIRSKQIDAKKLAKLSKKLAEREKEGDA